MAAQQQSSQTGIINNVFESILNFLLVWDNKLTVLIANLYKGYLPAGKQLYLPAHLMIFSKVGFYCLLLLPFFALYKTHSIDSKLANTLLIVDLVIIGLSLAGIFFAFFQILYA